MEWKNFGLAVLLAINLAAVGFAAHWRNKAESSRKWAAAVEWEARSMVEVASHGR